MKPVSLRRRAAIITVACLLALLGAAFAMHRYLDRNYAQPTRDLSKMMSVRLITAEALAEHYKEHGSYPQSLSELPLQKLPWGDEGSSLKDLAGWSYTSDDSSFTMTWTNARGTELFLSGTRGQDYYSREEKKNAGQQVR